MHVHGAKRRREHQFWADAPAAFRALLPGIDARPGSGAAGEIAYNQKLRIPNPTMSHPAEVLHTARARGRAANLPYAGAVTPQEAYTLLQADPAVKLVDVRTNAERDWIGKVDIPSGQHAAIEWNGYPGGVQNPHFLTLLEQAADKDDVLLFLCRSGVRSQHAARLATAHGYRHCFNILEGFEGNKDAAGHRKTVEGWCHAGLPWLGA